MPNRLSGPVQRSFVLSSGIEPVIFCLLASVLTTTQWKIKTWAIEQLTF